MFDRPCGIPELDSVKKKVVVDPKIAEKINCKIAKFFGMYISPISKKHETEPRLWIKSDGTDIWGVPNFLQNDAIAYKVFRFLQENFNDDLWYEYYQVLMKTILDRIDPENDGFFSPQELVKFFNPKDAVLALATFLDQNKNV